jgi:transposase
LYGYLNGLRGSRKLEKECERNIELHWLLYGMIPNYHSISDFRKDNPQALKKLFKLFVSFMKDADLITGETIAIDGTKSRAHNSKKANFSQKRLIGTLNTSTRKWRNTCLFWLAPMCRMNK